MAKAAGERTEILKKYTSDGVILSAVESVAFSQDELLELAKESVSPIYLCGEKFAIPCSFEGITYIGVNSPKVYVYAGSGDIGAVWDFEYFDADRTETIRNAEVTTDSRSFKPEELWQPLADLYFNGQGVPQNYEMAAMWYRDAAEQSNPYAEYRLGLCYFEGIGVEKNLDSALEWLKYSAEDGWEDAKEMLKKHFNEE